MVTFSVSKFGSPDTFKELRGADPAEIKMEPKISFGRQGLSTNLGQ
jgi:hypothetical protein